MDKLNICFDSLMQCSTKNHLAYMDVTKSSANQSDHDFSSGARLPLYPESTEETRI